MSKKSKLLDEVRQVIPVKHYDWHKWWKTKASKTINSEKL